jgi:hypothetical protein
LKQPQSLKGLSLSDVLIMRNWLVYAEEIGDNSYSRITSEAVSSGLIIQSVKLRSIKTPDYLYIN